MNLKNPSGIIMMGQSITSSSNYYIQVDVNFTMWATFPAGTNISVNIPQISKGSKDTGAIAVVEKYGSMPVYWKSYWHASTQRLELTALRTISAGEVQSFTVGSKFLALADNSIYENDTSIVFWVSSPDCSCSVFAGNFDWVHSRGLRTSALSFASTVSGVASAITVSASLDGTFTPGDTLYVSLPGYASASGTNVQSLVLKPGSSLGLNVSWSKYNSTIRVAFMPNYQPMSSVIVVISELNDILTPSTGLNNITGLPSIAYVDAGIQTFFFTPFKTFTPFIRLSVASIQFPIGAAAGAEVNMTVTIGFGLPILIGDTFDLTLPRFWSSRLTTNGVGIANTWTSFFSVNWRACSEVLTLTAIAPVAKVASASIGLVISGMRLPYDGISRDLASTMSISANTSNGVVPSTVFAVPLIGYFRSSSLTFQSASISSIGRITVQFSLMSALAIGDVVSAFLPGLVIGSPSVQSCSQVLYTGDILTTSSFSVTWVQGTSTLALTATSSIAALANTTVTITGSISVVAEGFPRAGVSPTISTNSVNGPVSASNFVSSSAVGFQTAEVAYDISTLSDYVGVRVKLFPSAPLTTGDIIVITCPVLKISASTVMNLVTTGDANDEKYYSYFNATFDPALRTINLIVITNNFNLRWREVTVFLGVYNQLSIDMPLDTSARVHKLSANLANVGILADRVIPYSPTNIARIDSGKVVLSSCSQGQFCSVDVVLRIQNTIGAGEMLALSHREFSRLSALDLYGQPYPFSLSATSNASSYFTVAWRPADNQLAMALVAPVLYKDNGDYVVSNVPATVTSDSDVDTHLVNTSFPSVSLTSASSTSNATVLTDLPRIVGVSATKIMSAAATCGDALTVSVAFSEPVIVTNGNLKLLLNTQELALYVSGSGTAILDFIYHIVNPTATNDLAVMGPSALDYFSEGFPIRKLGYPAILANTTIPPPHGMLLRSGGTVGTVSVSCTAPAYVRSVTSYSGSRTYAVGDILDIAVDFSRAISVHGVPTITLQPAVSPGSTSFTASFVNVSLLQWIDIYSGQPVSVSYKNSSTACLAWNDVTSMTAQLQTLPSLTQSLPIAITPYSLPSGTGFRYRLHFMGVAPGPLAVSDQCSISVTTSTTATLAYSPAVTRADTSTSTGAALRSSAYYDTTMLTTAVFRYTVKPGDMVDTTGLSYVTGASVILPTGASISVATVDTVSNAVLSLPTPSAVVVVAMTSAAPVITSVNASFTGSVGSAVAGNTVVVNVVFSVNVFIKGYPYLTVQLGSCSDTTVIPVLSLHGSQCTRRAVYLGSGGSGSACGLNVACTSNMARFGYTIVHGDTTAALDLAAGATPLSLNGSSILALSVTPSTAANLNFPPSLQSGVASGLRSSAIAVSSLSNPNLAKVYTDHAPGAYGAGEVILIFLKFQGVVFLKNQTTISGIYNSSNQGRAFAVFNSPRRYSVNYAPSLAQFPTYYQANMTYVNGSGTDTLCFQYRVKEQDGVAPINFWADSPGANNAGSNFSLSLQNGIFSDLLGNRWSVITNNNPAPDVSQLNSVTVDALPPNALYANSTTPDGTYYSGDSITLYVVFDKPVVILNGSPRLRLSIYCQHGDNLFAKYIGGNGTKTIFFQYDIPPPEPLKGESLLQLDYDSVDALYRGLGSSLIYSTAPNPVTAANVFLPPPGTSTLGTRKIWLAFTYPKVLSVYTSSPSAVYTAGDIVHLVVQFSEPVMVFIPPVLRLETGSSDRSAIFVGGNRTDRLLFDYTVMTGDSSGDLDYVDTRLPPYNMTSYATSLALNTDIQQGHTGRFLDNPAALRSNDVLLIRTYYGGVYRLNTNPLSKYSVVSAITTLPLPGQPGSLSYTSAISIDTTRPYVRQVYTPAKSGVFSLSAVLPIYMQFSAPVVLFGCPKLLFQVSGVDRYASYVSGNGTALLRFQYLVSYDDNVVDLDYRNRDSLSISRCPVGGNVSTQKLPRYSIMRNSLAPQIEANLTLPWVKYVESVIAPTSISGSGNHIVLVGSAVYPRMVWTSSLDDSNRTYGVGDVIDIHVTYSGPVSAAEGTAFVLSDIDRSVLFEAQTDPQSLTFRYVPQYAESTIQARYPDQFAILTKSVCDIKDQSSLKSVACAAQQLPVPFSSAANASDNLGRKNILISSDQKTSKGAAAYVNFIYQTVNVQSSLSDGGSKASPNNFLDIFQDEVTRLATVEVAAYRECDSTGRSYGYFELLDLVGGRRIITRYGCPNHYVICQRADCAGKNTSSAITTTSYHEVPLYPVMANNPKNVTCEPSILAVALNGVGVFGRSGSSRDCTDTLQQTAYVIDKCGGLASSLGEYQYKVPPICLIQQMASSPNSIRADAIPAGVKNYGVLIPHGPQIAWALDGFPVYGGIGPNNTAMFPCGAAQAGQTYCLDKCNGYFGALPEIDAFMYRYYMPGSYGNGQCSSSIANTKLGGQCARGVDGCCINTLPSSLSTNAALTIGCFAGCRLSDAACIASSTISGTTLGYVPKKARAPTDIFDGTPQTYQSTLDAVSTAAPTAYLPSIWDDLSIVNSGSYTSGSIVTVNISFTEAVYVRGNPQLVLSLDTAGSTPSTSPFTLSFQTVKEKSIFFTAAITSAYASPGTITCKKDSMINLNFGGIYRRSNFLPVLQPELYLKRACCSGSSCTQAIASITPNIPRVTRVYSPSVGTHFYRDIVYIYVDFSVPVLVIGTPLLRLRIPINLAGSVATSISVSTSYATFQQMYDENTLIFLYVVGQFDSTSSLEYDSTDALIISSGLYDGIFMKGVYASIPANLQLPALGAAGSLGFESTVIFDLTKPAIKSISSPSMFYSAGDTLAVNFDFSSDMTLLCGGVNMMSSLLASSFATGQGAPNDGLALMTVSLSLQANKTGISTSLVANLGSIVKNRVSFYLYVTKDMPTGVVFIPLHIPFSSPRATSDNDRCTLVDAVSRVGGQAVLLDSQIKLTLSIIDNEVARITRVYSRNTGGAFGKFPWGAGDVIDIYMDMSMPVALLTTPSLSIKLSEGFAIATYAETVVATNPVNILHFTYVVPAGVYALPLDYTGVDALVGDIRRWSVRPPILVANLTLPAPGNPGSLSYCCNIQIDTDPPYVDSLIPLKRVGMYGANELIVIVARFTKPVIVYGKPTLTLSTGVGGITSQAKFIKNFSAYDLSLDIRNTDVLFSYTVQVVDNIPTLQHAGNGAFNLSNAAVVKHLTMTPTTLADVSLRDPSDFTPLNGLIQRQWKARFARNVEVLLRDAYHTRPSSLTAQLQHVGKFATLFTGCCNANTLGRDYPRTRGGNNISLHEPDTGIGYDYFFSDTRAENIALRGAATQSSSLAGPPYLAIDGNADPLIGHASVTETAVTVEAWWQLQLPPSSVVNSVNIWTRKPEIWLDPVVSISIRALNAYPQGTFSLMFSSISKENPSYKATSGPIPFGASASDLKTVLESMKDIGKVLVEMNPMQLCGGDNGQSVGCGAGGVEKGYGSIYKLTLINVQAQKPEVQIVNIVTAGGAMKVGNYTVVNKVNYDLSTSVSLIRQGQSIQVPEIYQYANGVTPVVPSNSTTATAAVAGQNQWLTPAWVMLFDSNNSPPPNDLNSSLAVAVWKQLVESIGDLEQIVLTRAVSAVFLKIQRVGSGSLSLAEVEVFSEELNTMAEYSFGAEIQPSPVTRPYQSLVPFMQSFANVQYAGRWLLQITQDTSKSRKLEEGSSGAYGTVSDWVLVITDLAGVVHTYYQDLTAELTSLPKYGKILNAPRWTPDPYGDWRENFDVGLSGEITAANTLTQNGKRSFGLCLGVDTSGANGVASPIGNYRYCQNNYGVAPHLSGSRTWGASPSQVFLRFERTIAYQPNPTYLGPDFFTYIIHDGLNVQQHTTPTGQGSSNEVTLNVRNCRQFQRNIQVGAKQAIHPVCSCAATEAAVISNFTACNSARVSTCQSSTSAKGSRHDFLNMCFACEVRGPTSGECQAETIRALALLMERGMCTTRPPMDCSDESFTKQGTELTNYLSLKPNFAYGSFTNLGKAFGAYGWYNSPALG